METVSQKYEYLIGKLEANGWKDCKRIVNSADTFCEFYLDIIPDYKMRVLIFLDNGADVWSYTKKFNLNDFYCIGRKMKEHWKVNLESKREESDLIKELSNGTTELTLKFIKHLKVINKVKEWHKEGEK
jgi:hypothetical protein